MHCKICHNEPKDIEEYVFQPIIYPQYYDSPEDYVRKEEGTFNPKTELFYCTDCYVKIGMPLGKA